MNTDEKGRVKVIYNEQKHKGTHTFTTENMFISNKLSITSRNISIQPLWKKIICEKFCISYKLVKTQKRNGR